MKSKFNATVRCSAQRRFTSIVKFFGQRCAEFNLRPCCDISSASSIYPFGRVSQCKIVLDWNSQGAMYSSVTNRIIETAVPATSPVSNYSHTRSTLERVVHKLIDGQGKCPMRRGVIHRRQMAESRPRASVVI